jgi:hypothetical protein
MQAMQGRLLRLPSLAETPGVLRHLLRMTDSFVHSSGSIAYIHIYSRIKGQRHGEHLHEAEPPLTFFVAQDSGMEGIACLDDVARAVVLALQVYEQTGSAAARQLAETWMGYVRYMQLPDNRFVNFIKDPAGTRSLNGQTSYPGGEPWTVRALTALASAFRILDDDDSLHRFQRTLFPPTGHMALNAVYLLALMDVYQVRPDYGYQRWIEDTAGALISAGPDYLRNQCGRDEVELYDYHQLQAVARAGRILSNQEYLAFAESTVKHFVEPVVKGGFYHVWPTDRDHQSVFDVSAIALGLEELYNVTQKERYRELALQCCEWLYGNNPAHQPVYDPHTGRCHDNINLQGEIAPTTGAESAAEAGFLQLLRCRLTGSKEGLEEAREN